MKTKVLRDLTLEELQQKHDDLWKEMFGLRVKHTLGQLENPLQLRAIRRDIARCKTLLTQQGVRETSRRRRQAAPVVAKAAAKPAGTKAAGTKARGRKAEAAASEAGAAETGAKG